MEALDQHCLYEFNTGFFRKLVSGYGHQGNLADADKWDGNKRQTEIFGEVINHNWKK